MKQTKWTREELFDLVWNTPLTTICKEQGWKIHQLQQTCRDRSIPLPPNGHWSKLRFGKADPKPTLPAMADDNAAGLINMEVSQFSTYFDHSIKKSSQTIYRKN